MSEPRVLRVSEAQQRQRLADLRSEMARVEEPAPSESEVPGEALDTIVERRLKEQLRSLSGKDLNIAIMNSIRFLAVRARLPVAFGGELDAPLDEPVPEP